MNLIERKEGLKKLKDELKELDSRAEYLSKNGNLVDLAQWVYYNEKPYEIERYALLSKIFVVEKDIEVWEENDRFRKECKRVGVLKNVLKRIEKMAIERNSKIAADISKEIAKREWENKEGHAYKLKGD
tara:strand:- start:173 stop:559 length:387 start_codon:yes stop_codon:yes gene_type:complete